MQEAMKEKYSHGWSELHELITSKGLSGVEKDMVSSDRVAETRQALTANEMIVKLDDS